MIALAHCSSISGTLGRRRGRSNEKCFEGRRRPAWGNRVILAGVRPLPVCQGKADGPVGAPGLPNLTIPLADLRQPSQCVYSLLRCLVRPLEPACFWLDEWFRPGQAFLQTREFAYSAFRGAWHRSRDRRRRTCWHGRPSQTPVLLPHLPPAQPGNRTEVRLCPGIDTPHSSDHRPWPSGPRSIRQVACAIRE
jgi:hypothetical protein